MSGPQGDDENIGIRRALVQPAATRKRRWRSVGAGVAASLLTVLITACGSEGSDDTKTGAGGSAAQGASAGAGQATPDPATGDRSAASAAPNAAPNGSGDVNRGGVGAALLPDQKLIHTAMLSIRVQGDVAVARRKAEDIALGAGGMIQSEQVSSESGSGRVVSADLVLRVPPDTYERTLRELADLGTPIDQSRDTKDVTQQVVDVESRIAIQRTSIERVRALLSRATKIGDIVSVESELTRREADLESLLAQQKALSQQTDLATIRLGLVAVGEEQVPTDDNRGFLAGLENGWHAFTGFVAVLLLIIGAMLPFLAAAALVSLVAIAALRRFRPRHAGATVGTEPPATT
jgi:hypothetical protein